MIAKRTPLALASIAALALAGLPAKAWAQHGGGRHGGGHHSGGHAVPRGGSPGHIPGGGGVAGARHPRAGTGTGGYYGYYGHGGRYGRYGYGYGGRYGHYRAYYGHYRPYGFASFYFGWPYYYSGWGPSAWVGSYDPGYYAPDPSYGMGYDARPAPPASEDGRYDESPRPEGSDPAYRAALPGNTGRLRLEVRPDDASVYVDDEFWGNARDTKSLILRAGVHAIEIVRPGFATARREVEVVRGETSDVLVELDRP